MGSVGGCLLFEEVVRLLLILLSLGDIKFPRSFKPANYNPDIDPDLAIFSDGNPHSF